MTTPTENDYSVTFDNRAGGTPINHDKTAPYTVSEHTLWAPRKLRVACIGAGASGIMMCYKKEKEFGDSIDLIVYERYPKPGGVWYANKYPGCRCDVPSPAYQYPFAPKSSWSRYYSPAAEIQSYYEEFATKNGYVDKYIKLSHRVNKAAWDETTGQWVLTISHTNESNEESTFEDRVDFLIANVGVLNTWKWPDIPNREAYQGKMTHSANYDTSLDLKDKTVIVIGSGASAIQIVPAIRPTVKKLISFYRTPQWIGPGLAMDGFTDSEGRNFDYTEEQKDAFAKNPEAYLAHRKEIETKINTSFRNNIANHPHQKLGREFVTQRMKNILKNDQRLVQRLIPTFPMGCRRLGPAEGFLEAFLEDNVELAEGEIESFTKDGLRTTDGTEYKVDVIICATGFDVSFKPVFPVVGRNNVSLSEAWKDDPSAYLAVAASGFPNFLIGSLGPNCPAGHGSFITVLEAAQNYVCKMIRKMQTENILAIDVKPEAVAEYNEHVHKWLERTVWAAGCRSWYNQGRPGGKITAQYPGSLVHWRLMLEHPRFEDYNIRYRTRNRFEFMGNGFTLPEVDGQDVAWYLDLEHIQKPLFPY
ncbi:putative sterigmatocystin biosynthesis monooxygenase stcW [Fusarium sp. Ph1]|nr:putative sterigmatocystin biosynthesis monooxygenase stcW [Fusarium sp. Ph1]